MTVAERGMGVGLKALNRLAGLEVLDRAGLRRPAERLLYRASRNGFRTATVAGRTFVAARRLARPARLGKATAGDLFDLTPTDEQRLMRDSIRDFGRDRLRPAAQEADAACAAPADLLSESSNLGLTMLGVPEELGGAMSERATVTSVLVAEALAHGDMGLAFAALAPGAVSTALGMWGDAEQQARYLPEFVGEAPPAAALALLEPRPLFDPFKLQTRARPDGEDYVLDGVKSLVPRAAEAELLLVAAELEGRGPALFVVEPGAAGSFTEPEPAMGLRAAATARLPLERLRVPAGALLADAQPEVYADCVRRGRLAWCALALGAAQAVVDYVIPYVNERVALGEPISHRQAVAFSVADAAIEVEGMRLATYRAAGRADRDLGYAREVTLARRLCSERGMAIGSDGVQLLGGHGYVKEHPVERWYRDLRTAGVMEGALLV